jgi:hypothetical protein
MRRFLVCVLLCSSYYQRCSRHAKRNESCLEQASPGNEGESPTRECRCPAKSRIEACRLGGQISIRATDSATGLQGVRKVVLVSCERSRSSGSLVRFQLFIAPAERSYGRWREIRTPIGIESWRTTSIGFANGLDKFLSVPKQPLVATSGAWSANEVIAQNSAVDRSHRIRMDLSIGHEFHRCRAGSDLNLSEP